MRPALSKEMLLGEHSAQDARPNAANFAAARVGCDRFEGVADQVAVFQRLSFAPPVSRAPEDVDDVAPR
jgi:hypothetical protein